MFHPNWSGWFHRTLIVLLVATTLGPVIARGQDRERRRQFIDGLLQTLVESQQDRVRPPMQPANPGIRASSELVRSRAALSQFSQICSQLINQLEFEQRTNVDARYLINDLLRIKAASTVLAQRAQQAPETKWLLDDYRDLDGQYRVFAHRARQVPDLSTTSRQLLKQMDEQARIVAGSLGIETQFNAQAVSRACQSIVLDLRHLNEDLDIELGRSRSLQPLKIGVENAKQQALRVDSFLRASRPYTDVVAEFKRFSESWQGLAAQLRPINNRYLERSARRIDTNNHEIHELLRLPEPVDYSQLTYLTETLSRDVDALFDTVSLNVLIELRGARNVVNVGGEFYGRTEQLTLAVSQKEPITSLATDFHALERAWDNLALSFETTRNANVARALQQVELTMGSLRTKLHLRPELDRRKAAELAASLEHHAGHLSAQLQRSVVLNRRYTQTFRSATAQQVALLRQSARSLQAGLAGNASDDALTAESSRLHAHWQALYNQHIAKLQDADRNSVSIYGTRVAPLVVELQTMLSL